MRKEIEPELFNYNKFPGPQFVSFDNIVKSDDIEFTMLENFKNAFDTTSFSQRFSELMLKYDYIVGDWASEQLRLKGFYKDDKKTANALKISRLEDYIKEYCSFGCAYFVLENKAPKEMPKEEFKGRSRKRRPRRKKTSNQNTKASQTDNNQKELSKNQNFQLKKAKRKKQIKNPQKETSQKSGEKDFIIRKKGNNK
ncbi:YutD family protein [Streptococcus pacificus]|uniref:DUF1027 domain-containing protein n=1 Tax=Streptococcus pacificus TaxID=2740577 RepID=A0ABS0ZIG2_9STRE|nr:YutD-like domain-containing protein [Streptococcus pacificus]MBJ8325737.1 DUF1027 domain-containing protein [Streptococcus pacificus]